MVATHGMAGKFTGLSDAELVHSHQAAGDNLAGYRCADAGGRMHRQGLGAAADTRSGTHQRPGRRVMVSGQLGLGWTARSPRDSVRLVQSALDVRFHIQPC